MAKFTINQEVYFTAIGSKRHVNTKVIVKDVNTIYNLAVIYFPDTNHIEECYLIELKAIN